MSPISPEFNGYKIMEAQKFMETINGDKPTLVDFYASWCGPCKMMHPVLEDFDKECGEKVNVVKIDVDHHTALSAQFGVQSVPTLILFKKGEVLWKQSGAMSLKVLQENIRQKLNEPVKA